jgi:diaminohydroxyphosphoribosylaminopyrimidine deaminase/5-amino-6-(5-phosphoribosylamino)uracil reductase
MRRCLHLAGLGLGTTRPNPSVGCVIVCNDVIIGEGYTSAYGGPHAEVNAINSVKDKTLLKSASLYVTLEPCSHHGKTPPCSDLIVAHEIPNIFIGTVDSNNKVSGKGIDNLKTSGCNVNIGVLEDDCKSQHKRFLICHGKGRPYIILKWAESQDGFMAPMSKDEKKPIWLTNIHSRQLVHKWRTEEHAILVGTNTISEDNPQLTARDWVGQNPIRVVMDRTHKLSKDHAIFDGSAKTIIISERDIDFHKPIASQICMTLHEKNIQSVIIEGGARTLQTFIDENLWDEARIFTSAVSLNNGLKAPVFLGNLFSEKIILQDHLRYYRNTNA